MMIMIAFAGNKQFERRGVEDNKSGGREGKTLHCHPHCCWDSFCFFIAGI